MNLQRYAKVVFSMLLGMQFMQCVNPQITGERLVLWRDINGLDEIHTGRFSWGHDRLVTGMLDTFYTAKNSFQLMARELQPTVWNAQDGGCLVIPSGVQVSLGYFRFQGNAPTDTLIIVDGGVLRLTGCDIAGPAGGGIIVRNGGRLILSESRILDIDRPLRSENGELDLAYVQVQDARGPGVEIRGGSKHRLKGLDIRKIDGVGVDISRVGESHLNQINLKAISGDGIQSTRIGQLHLDSIQIQETGGRGLFLTQIEKLRIGDVKISSSGLTGAEMNRVDRADVVRLTSTKNGLDGLRVALFDTLKISQSLLYKNGQRGGVFEEGLNLYLTNGVSSENQGSGLWIHDVDCGILDSMQVKLNQIADSTAGIFISGMDELSIQHSHVQYNVGNGLVVGPMPAARLVRNTFIKNLQSGAVIQSVQDLVLDENQFMRNVTGMELTGIGNLLHRGNVYAENSIGLVAKASSLQSEKNAYSRQEVTGVELMDSHYNGGMETFIGNRFGLTAVGGSVNFHNGELVGNGVGIYVKASSVNIQETNFEHGETGIHLKEITTGMIQNSHFSEQTGRGVEVESSGTLIFSNNRVVNTPLGVRLQDNDFVNFSRNEISNSSGAGLVWDRNGNGILRYNIIVNNDTAVRVMSDHQIPAFENNTLVANGVCFDGVHARDVVARYNIFQGNRMITREPMGPSPVAGGTWEYNCFWENESVPDAALDKAAGNFTAQPVFQPQYYLKSASPCLEVGPERRLAGARGLTPAIKPKTD
ncbi:MAG: right-handed parallel beta-helix repeat-containing protein [Candidatus Marinimicrobia bacterium]|nr:right-handed parallel beta-helix repeat-containing protein [Candidatus Neomarinimicrobiota bacterium]